MCTPPHTYVHIHTYAQLRGNLNRTFFPFVLESQYNGSSNGGNKENGTYKTTVSPHTIKTLTDFANITVVLTQMPL